MELVIGSNTIRDTNGVLEVGGKKQIFLEIGDDGQLLLTMEVYDDQGAHIAKLRRNAWTFNNDERFSIATNPERLTLTDKNTGQCVVEVRVLDKDRISIPRGNFYSAQGVAIEITPDYWRVANRITISGSTIDSSGGVISLD